MSQVSGTFIGSVIVLILGSKLGNAGEVSKACYGAPGLQCTRHNLTCSSGHIAIQEAFFTDNTACGSGISSCTVDVSSIPLTGTRYNFSKTELNPLYGTCSTQSTCSLRAGRRGAPFFSAIRYQCSDVVVSKACYGSGGLPCMKHNLMCSSGRIAIQEAFYTDNTTFEVHVSKACLGSPGLPCTTHALTCSSGSIAIQEAFYTDNTACGSGLKSHHGLDLSSIPLTGTRYNFTDTELDSLYGNCSTQSTCSLPAGRRVVLPYSAITYQCINGTTLSSPQQPTTITLSGTTENEVSPSNKKTGTYISIGGIFAAGLFSGLCIAAVIAGVVYFLYIRRRCIIKKPDDGPASVIHPTYAGLTELGRPDTYDVINRPEGPSRSSESTQAPVYQNVDDDS